MKRQNSIFLLEMNPHSASTDSGFACQYHKQPGKQSWVPKTMNPINLPPKVGQQQLMGGKVWPRQNRAKRNDYKTMIPPPGPPCFLRKSFSEGDSLALAAHSISNLAKCPALLHFRPLFCAPISVWHWQADAINMTNHAYIS